MVRQVLRWVTQDAAWEQAEKTEDERIADAMSLALAEMHNANQDKSLRPEQLAKKVIAAQISVEQAMGEMGDGVFGPDVSAKVAHSFLERRELKQRLSIKSGRCPCPEVSEGSTSGKKKKKRSSRLGREERKGDSWKRGPNFDPVRDFLSDTHCRFQLFETRFREFEADYLGQARPYMKRVYEIMLREKGKIVGRSGDLVRDKMEVVTAESAVWDFFLSEGMSGMIFSCSSEVSLSTSWSTSTFTPSRTITIISNWRV